jgi:UDP-N-acetyl-2-amino-2-deoxyglucuronate dehydrogenase
VRYGIVGCGRVHRNHAQAVRALDGVELVGIADLAEEPREAAAAEWGVPGYADYRDLIAAGVDAVSVCLPHHLHAPVCADLANQGVHILCEKPLATSLEDCDLIIDAAKRNGVRLGVVYQHRFNANSQLLRKLLDSGQLGKPILGTALFQYHKSPDDTAYFAGSGWRGTWEREGGGVLNTHAIHAIDLVCWLLGSVCDARGEIATLTHKVEVEDTGVALLRFDNGALATVAASMSVGVGFESRVTMSGTRGVAVLSESRRLDVQYLDGSTEAHVFDQRLDAEEFRTNIAYGRGHIAQIDDFVTAIREGRAPLCSGEDGRAVVEVVRRIYETARS